MVYLSDAASSSSRVAPRVCALLCTSGALQAWQERGLLVRAPGKQDRGSGTWAVPGGGGEALQAMECSLV